MAIYSHVERGRVFRGVLFLLLLAAALAFVPMWASLVLAAWVAGISRPLLERIAKATGGRERAAGVLVVALLMLMLVPIAGALLFLVRDAIGLAQSLLHSPDSKNALIAIANGGEKSNAETTGELLDLVKSPARIFALVQDYGAQAAGIASQVAGAAGSALLGFFVFVYAVYVFLVDGPTRYEWFEQHAPLERHQVRRLAAAFRETGRGLFVGVGLTGLAQGVVATVTYLTLGVRRALVLGLLTCIASLIPSVGTALVWVPVAVGLALAGKTVAAAVMVGVGVLVIGTVDNLLRPVFARFGNLDLSSFALLVSIFGGLAMFGTGGLVLGPLFVRLAKEALMIARGEPAKMDERGAPAEGDAAESAPETKGAD